MSKISIIIPACNEKPENLERTLESIYENATGEIEIIVGFNGPEYIVPKKIDERYTGVFLPRNVGIKTNINLLAAMAEGEYIYKSDAHCRFGKGFDEILTKDIEDDWIVMPRFNIIKDDWSIQIRNGEEEFYDYFYLCCPFTDPKGFRFKAGGHWKERTQERLSDEFYSRGVGDNTSWPTHIDETPQIHGSGWIMKKDRFFELGGFPNIDPYGHAQEPIWLALKNWLMGGKVMVNKNTWYAHLHQQGNKRGYHMDKAQENKSYDIAARYFVGDKGHFLYNFAWFVEKFYPMPTWPENWEKLLVEWQKENE